MVYVHYIDTQNAYSPNIKETLKCGSDVEDMVAYF